VVTALLVIAGIGVVTVAMAPAPWVALSGFALMGIGMSAVYPIVVSAAAQRTDRPAEANVAALAQISFTVFFFGPPLLGFVAEYFGIRMTYLVCLPLVLVSLWFTSRLGDRAGPRLAGVVDPVQTSV
jgi:MFS family permease